MLTNPKTIFGVHSLTLYDRDDRIPFAFLRVLGDCNIDLKGETEDLNGGSQMFPFDSEAKAINSEFSLTAREYPVSVMENFLAATRTDLAANSSGEAIDFANVKGTSLKNSVTGIATVGVKSGSEADLKEGEYLIEVTAANKVKVYSYSDINFKRGTDASFVDDTLVVASEITITAATASDVTNFGLQLTGGSGTIGMNIGDTARFTVRRPSVQGVSLLVGAPGAVFPEFGAILCAQARGDGSITYIDLFRCKANGMPINLKEKGFSEWSLTIKMLVDETQGGVFRFVRNW